jgi:CheY-like chemotaxis protein
MATRTWLMWLIDDSASNHAVARLTATRFPQLTLSCFYSGAEAIATWTAHHSTSEPLPDWVLMDYYLIDERGDHVTRDLRQTVAAAQATQPLIIGYSSVASGSEAIVRAGADVIVRKHSDNNGINPSLAVWLQRATALNN